jgi:hypothetical protein
MKPISLAVLALVGAAAFAQPAQTTSRVRGSIEKIDATSIVVRERGGQTMTLALPDTLAVTEVLPIDPGAIQSGTFVGTTAVPGADGSLSAVEVHVFPEAARGTGEGHRPWDLSPGSTMTNATVTAIAPGAGGRKMTLRYKDGEKTIVVPEGVPIITMQPADRSLLVAGAKVLVFAETRNGQPTALRIMAGRNGFAPPL